VYNCDDLETMSSYVTIIRINRAILPCVAMTQSPLTAGVLNKAEAQLLIPDHCRLLSIPSGLSLWDIQRLVPSVPPVFHFH